MNQGPLIFLGVLATMALSWSGMILTPQLQIGRQAPVVQEELGDVYPKDRSGLAHQGAEVYRSLGCAACHSQQVGATIGDIPRYGKRITVAADYLFDRPVQLGSVRIGPDLANIGVRQTNASWHFLHLYNPRLTAAGSTMPSYPYLFDVVSAKSGQKLPADAILAGEQAILPRKKAIQLAGYLLSLKSEGSLFEAPIPGPHTNSTATTTNATTAVTNSPAKATNAVPAATPPAK